MNSRNILFMLGLAKRSGRLIAGEEPVEAVTRARDARVVFLASDTSDNTRRRAKRFAEVGQCLCLPLPFSKDELGHAVGRTSTAIVAVTDIGLAAAIVHRLAEVDPQRYDDPAARLDLKAQRAAERRSEEYAHQRNLRQGKRKVRVEPAPKKQDAPHSGEKSAPSQRDDRRPYSASKAYDGSKSRFDGKTYDRSKPHSDGKPYSGDKSRSGDKAYDRDKFQSAGRPRSTSNSHSGPQAKRDRYAHSRPVKKGKGSFRKRQG